MRIVVTGTRGIPNVQGGIETHCQELYPRLAELGHEVTVIRRSPYVNDGNRGETYKGVKLVDIYSPKSKSMEAIVHTALSVIKARKLKPDLLHVHGIGPSLLIPLAKLFGTKVVMTHHGFDYERQKWGRLAKTMIKMGERFAVRYADCIIAVSDHIADRLKRVYGRTDIHVIYNGVNKSDLSGLGNDIISAYGLKGNDYVFAMGRLVPEKGFHDLIAAYSGLPEEIKGKYKLVIAGDADHDDEYSANLKRMAGDAPGVIMTGYVRGEMLSQLLGNAALFVMPSYHEGLPIALLEALSYGRDVVVSDIEAHKLKVLAGEGCHYPVGDVGALAEMIEMKLSGPRMRREYDLGEYDWDRIAAATEKVYGRKA